MFSLARRVVQTSQRLPRPSFTTPLSSSISTPLPASSSLLSSTTLYTPNTLHTPSASLRTFTSHSAHHDAETSTPSFRLWHIFGAFAGLFLVSQRERFSVGHCATEDPTMQPDDPSYRRARSMSPTASTVEPVKGKRYDLPSSRIELAQRLDKLRGSKGSMWPPVWLSQDRPFVKFAVRPTPQFDLIRFVITAFGNTHGPLEIAQDRVGSWTCLQLYSPTSGLVIVLATSPDGATLISVEKERHPDQSHDEWASWTSAELDFISNLYLQGNRAVQQSVSELEKLGLKIYKPDEGLTWDDIAGYDDVKKEVQNTIILALRHPEVYDKITAQTRRSSKSSNLPKAILFEGSPGVGKTQMARVIAASVSVPLIYVPVESVMSKWYGESEQILSKIFDACAQLGEAIIFIDEIDSLATSRSGEMHEATRRVLSVLLRKIEGFEQKHKTIVIGATNRKQDLDEALLSRFDVSIAFRLPTEEERAQILSVYAHHLSQEDLKQLARATPRASGRDLRDICAHAERAWAAEIIKRGLIAQTPPPPLEEYLNSIPSYLTKMRS